MPYQFATEKFDYTDYSSGRVIYNAPGAPAFPVRLASEIFLRAQAARQRLKLPTDQRLVLYDPTCGGAYHLSALGFLYGSAIQAILASDADEAVLALAERNLGLLSAAGLARREHELTGLHDQYGKDSHAGALESLAVLRQKLGAFPEIRTRTFLANALDPAALRRFLAGENIDLVISDVPYGQMSDWLLPREASAASPVWQLLDSLQPVLSPGTMVCIAANKTQKAAHEAYQRLDRFQIGKRQVTLLQPSGARQAGSV
jgi:hypothetical protein